MAVFTEADLARLDWRLLQNGPICLYHRREVLDEHVAVLQANAWTARRFSCADWSDATAMLRALAHGLSFPDYFGMNLDALNDCLGDVAVPDESGLALVFDRFDVFAATDPEVAQALLDIAADNARRFLLFGRRFLVLAQSDDPRISFDPVGATAVDWNPNEWLAAKRGL